MQVAQTLPQSTKYSGPLIENCNMNLALDKLDTLDERLLNKLFISKLIVDVRNYFVYVAIPLLYQNGYPLHIKIMTTAFNHSLHSK